MTTQTLLFTDPEQDELLATNGSTVTQLAIANGSFSPAFLSDPIYYAISTATLGSDAYITMADTTGGTSAIWRYNGTTLTQITASSNYVFNQPDGNNAVAPDPLATFNGNLIFSQASLASNTAGDGNFDKATLAVYNFVTGAITQPSTPNGGYDPGDFVTLNGTLYFTATDSTTNAEAIYSYNGTSVTEIYNLHPSSGGAPVAGAVLGPLVAYNGTLYFGSGGKSIEELTSTSSLSNSATDLTPSPTVAYSFNGESPATDLIVANGLLYFLTENNGVFAINGSNSITNIGASDGADSFVPVVYNSKLYYVTDVLNTLQTFLVPDLYDTTGASAGAVLASDVSAGDFIVSGTTLFYDNGGTGLGTINGTTIGTLTVPGGVGGQPLVALPFAATAWAAASSPIAITAGATATFHNGGGAVALDSALTLTDSASSTLTSAAVVLNGDLVAGDTLNFTNQNGITGSYDPNTWVLTLAGSASLANYQTALDSITYSFSPGDGDATDGGTATTRSVDWAVTDSANNNSLAATSSLNVSNAAVSAPVITGISPDTGVSSTDGITDTGALTIDGTAASGTTIDVYNGATLIGTGTTGSGGTWSVTLGTALAKGSYTLTATAASGGTTSSLSSGFAVSVDTTPPAVTSIDTVQPSSNTGGTEQFTVDFSESVIGVSTSAFTLAETGSVTGTISSVSASSGSSITVTITGASGTGTMDPI